MQIAILSRRDDARLAPIAAAFREHGCDVLRLVYRDEAAREIREQLVAVRAALVWVDPISGGEDRTTLNALLRDVAGHGVMVSAHPDTIDSLGTKDVLFRTRQLGWGNDIARYTTIDDLRAGLRPRLEVGPRVIKRERGNGGIGVWRVEAIDNGRVAVHGAEARDLTSEELSFDEFVERCAPYFTGGGCVIDQRFEPRVAEGIVRCYLVVDQVVGFAHQGPGELATNPALIMGLPSPKTMFPRDVPDYASLRRSMEADWVPALCRTLDLTRDQLPLLWDADFLLGAGDDHYVLCEINTSCITPFPPETPAILAAATLARLQGDPA